MGGLVVAVEDIRVQVGAIGPGDCPDLRVNSDLCEQVVVPRDLLEYRTPHERPQINHALGTVRERETDSPFFDYFDFGDIDHRTLLREWLNGTGRLMIDGAFPADFELRPLEIDPFAY
jgi:hypothetical protein